MAEITFSEMVYCRVEEKYSPSRSSGYQTAFKSLGLSQEETNLIEERLKCFRPLANQQVIKLQFFSLPNGKMVISHFSLIESDPEIIDKAQRDGMYLAHCLIFEPKEIQKCNTNPFLIFDKFNFLTSGKELVNRYLEVENKYIQKTVVVDVDYLPKIGEKWWGQALQLYSLAKMARKSEEMSSKSILLYGDSSEIISFLFTVFHFTPPSMRANCSFDTFVDNCKVKPGTYWAVGSSQKSDDIFIPINVSEDTFEGFSFPTQAKRDAYADWLETSLVKFGRKTYFQVPSIHNLYETLAGKGTFQYGGVIDKEAQATFFDVNSNYVADFLASIFGRITSKAIARDLAFYVVNILDHAYTQNIITTRSIPNDFNWLLKRFILNTAPTVMNHEAASWMNLATYCDRFDDNVLKLWLALLASDTNKQKSLLGGLDEVEFREAIQLAGALFSPTAFSSSRYLEVLLSFLKDHQTKLQDDEFLDIVREILTLNKPQLLNYLIYQVSRVDHHELKQLEKTIGRYKNIPPDFKNALVSRKTVLSSRPKGIKKWLSGK